MELSLFKDRLFDLLNESDEMEISDVEVDDESNLFTVSSLDGTVFEIECRQVSE